MGPFGYGSLQRIGRPLIYFDELIFFPQPYLSSLLYRILQQDLIGGLKHTANIAVHPYQSWAAQRALKKLLSQDQALFFRVLDQLLTSPPPYSPIWPHPDRLRVASFRYRTATGTLVEMADLEVFQSWSNKWEHRLTSWLRLRSFEKMSYTQFASAYHDLLVARENMGDDIAKGKGIVATTIIEDFSLDSLVTRFEKARDLPHGEEFYQSLRLITASLHCESLQDVAELRGEFTGLLHIEDQLRPRIVSIFRCLHDVAIDAALFLTSANEIT